MHCGKSFTPPLVVFRQCGKSFMYKRNSIGPRLLLPCGTPHFISLCRDIVPLTEQACFLFLRYDLNQSRLFPLIPYSSSFDNSMSWLTVSKAFLRSRNRTPFTKPLSILSNHSLVELMSAVSVECFGRKPDC